MPIITSLGVFPGKPLKGEQKYSKLYHYTSLDTFKLIWNNKQLKFGTIANVNDLNEYSKKISIPCNFWEENIQLDELQNRFDNILNIINSYKQISLSMDYDSYIKGCMSPMMWGHYGDKGKGVCIELDYSKIKFQKGMYYKPVRYVNLIQDATNIPPNLTKISSIESYIKNKISSIYFTKTRDWKGENEFRIISNQFEYLDISNAISTVYVTNSFSKTCESVEKIVADIIPVKFLHNISSKGKRLIVLSNTKKYRDCFNRDLNKPER